MHIAAMGNNKDNHNKDDYNKDDHNNCNNQLLDQKMKVCTMGPSLILRPLSFLFLGGAPPQCLAFSGCSAVRLSVPTF